MIKKIFFFLIFYITYSNIVFSFRMNDDFIFYIIDNELQNTSKLMDKYYSKNKITNNVYDYVIKFTYCPPKKKNNKLTRIRNSTRKKKNEECQENRIQNITPLIPDN